MSINAVYFVKKFQAELEAAMRENDKIIQEMGRWKGAGQDVIRMMIRFMSSEKKKPPTFRRFKQFLDRLKYRQWGEFPDGT